MTNKLTRRQWHKTVFEAGVACVAGTAGPAFMLSACTDNKQRVDAGLDPLIVHGGPATPSLPLIHLAESGLLAPVVQKTQFQMFRGHDEVRAGIVGNGWPVSMVSTQLAANLYNKKMPIRFMAVLTWGLTYFISRQPGITRIEHLAGSRIALSSKNDLNDQMFAYLTRRAGMVPDKDMHVSYMASPMEAVQWLHAGRVDHVLLAEPQCSAALAPQGQAPFIVVSRLVIYAGRLMGRAVFQELESCCISVSLNNALIWSRRLGRRLPSRFDGHLAIHNWQRKRLSPIFQFQYILSLRL